ncbi:MAG: hypothetical protein PHZ19_02720 [Candidatus Thermoplasmatota archaeon]|nr:hypothetical protein [Candidatus Thermoplasmatota archaeon]
MKKAMFNMIVKFILVLAVVVVIISLIPKGVTIYRETIKNAESTQTSIEEDIDLKVSESDINCAENTVTVHNIGEKDAKDIEIRINDVSGIEIRVVDLPGESSIPIPFSGDSITIKLDPDNKIEEKIEDNNAASINCPYN